MLAATLRCRGELSGRIRAMRVVLVAIALSLQTVPAQAASELRLATTTSTENSGLLAYLLPMFEARLDVKVRVIAVGSGKALRLGENGDVDVLLTHSRAEEEKFMAAGHGVARRDVMYNDFLIVGPVSDVARIGGGNDAVAAFKAIARTQQKFISRGDESGTHSMEKSLWLLTGVPPSGDWYLPAGLGMAEVLAMTAELRAYTLTDRATYLGFKGRADLEEMVAGDDRLFNAYSVIVVNPMKSNAININLARQFSAWLTGVDGQRAIAAFRIKGQQVFFPSAR